MDLVRSTRPRRDVVNVRDEMDRAFDRFFRNWLTPVSYAEFAWSPSVDISETEDTIEVKAELPGVSEDDIDISVSNGQLVISGEKKQEEEQKEKNYYRVERSYGSFMRTFALPSGVDQDRITAECSDGVLTVSIPKSGEAKMKKIEVKKRAK